MVLDDPRPEADSSFADLFEQYKNLVYKTAYLMLDDVQEAEDALQEVFLRVYENLASYDETKGAFSTWLYRVTINHCLNRQRKWRPLKVPLGAITQRPSPNGHRRTEEQLAEAEVIGLALGHLSDKQRAVVVLRYYWDLPYAEMADILEVPVGPVKSRLNQAMKVLTGDGCRYGSCAGRGGP